VVPQLQLAIVTWLVPAIVLSPVVAQIGSTCITAPLSLVFPLHHHLVVGLPLGATGDHCPSRYLRSDTDTLFCLSDNVAARTLGVGMAVNGPLTVELCTQACFDANYSLSGVEYADECCECPKFHMVRMNPRHFVPCRLWFFPCQRWCPNPSWRL